MQCILCRNDSNDKESLLCGHCAKAIRDAEESLPCRFETLSCSHQRARTRLCRQLSQQIFHITDAKGFMGIVRTGDIRPNIAGVFGNNWGTKNSYFRNRGCISVCDFYHNTSVRKRYEATCKYNFYDLPCNNGLGYFMVLKSVLFGKMITWDAWKHDRKGSEDVVPDLESGYPGTISLKDIDFVVKVQIEDHFTVSSEEFEAVNPTRL